MTDVIIPFPEAATRAEARDNAMRLVREAERYSGDQAPKADRLTSMALVWSRIAATFPEDPVFVDIQEQMMRSVVEEDHRPYPASDETQYIPSSDETSVIPTGLEPHREPIPAAGVNGGTVVVDAVIWDVLRYLSASMLVAMPDRRTILDLDDIRARARQYELFCLRMGDDPSLHVVYQDDMVR